MSYKAKIYCTFILLLFGVITISSKFPEFHHNSIDSIINRKISGKELLQDFPQKISNENFQYISIEEDEPIFWDLENGSVINYNPVVLFVNYYYWDYLSFYNSSEEYIFEMYANGSIIFDSNYSYAKYNEFYWDLGYDWNISAYSPGTNLNLKVFFYQEDDININHTASIYITIDEIRESSEVDYNSFKINLFHWPGTLYSGGYYYFYEPNGLNPYYHFQIFEDGYVELKFGDLELYDSSDLSSEEAKLLMEELISFGFFQFKDAYFAPGYDYYYNSYYQIFIDSKSTQEWRQAEEARETIIKPQQYAKCLEAITDCVSELYFTPKRWRWELFLIIAGSSLGGVGVVATSVYLIFAYRRRR